MELKPCPFCGRVPAVEVIDNRGYFIKCKCGIEESHVYRSKQSAIKKWNRRKSDGKEVT